MKNMLLFVSVIICFFVIVQLTFCFFALYFPLYSVISCVDAIAQLFKLAQSIVAKLQHSLNFVQDVITSFIFEMFSCCRNNACACLSLAC